MCLWVYGYSERPLSASLTKCQKHWGVVKAVLRSVWYHGHERVLRKKKKWLIWKQINLGPAIGLRKRNGTWNLEFQMEAGMSLKISVQIENSTSNLKVCIKKKTNHPNKIRRATLAFACGTSLYGEKYKQLALRLQLSHEENLCYGMNDFCKNSSFIPCVSSTSPPEVNLIYCMRLRLAVIKD